MMKQCSIDSLLDRTIKYMVFLQGVTKHADKLKRSNEPKVIDCFVPIIHMLMTINLLDLRFIIH